MTLNDRIDLPRFAVIGARDANAAAFILNNSKLQLNPYNNKIIVLRSSGRQTICQSVKMIPHLTRLDKRTVSGRRLLDRIPLRIRMNVWMAIRKSTSKNMMLDASQRKSHSDFPPQKNVHRLQWHMKILSDACSRIYRHTILPKAACRCRLKLAIFFEEHYLDEYCPSECGLCHICFFFNHRNI